MNIDLNELIKIENRDNPIIVNRYQTKDIDITPIDKNISRIKTYYRNINKLNTSIEDIPCITSLRISSDIDLSNLNFCNCKDANGQFDENLVPKNLEYLYYDGTQSQIDPVKDGIFNTSQSKLQSRLSSLKACIMPNMTKVYDHMFKNCKSLVSVDIGNAVDLKRYAFFNCLELTNISKNNKLNENLKEIPPYGFANCFSLKSIDISNISSINSASFLHCKKIENIGNYNVLNNDIKYLPYASFSRCDMMKSIDLNQVSSLGNYVFYNCYSLSNIVANNVKDIGICAFDGCEAISSIILNNAISLSANAFSNCNKLKLVFFNNLRESSGDEFSNTTDLSIYYKDPYDFSKPDNYYPDNLQIETFSFMNGDWAFIMPITSYKQLQSDIIDDPNSLKVAAYKDYLNVDWVPGDPWGTHTDPKFKNEDGSIKEQHIITIESPRQTDDSDYNLEIGFNMNDSSKDFNIVHSKLKDSAKDGYIIITK